MGMNLLENRYNGLSIVLDAFSPNISTDYSEGILSFVLSNIDICQFLAQTNLPTPNAGGSEQFHFKISTGQGMKYRSEKYRRYLRSNENPENYDESTFSYDSHALQWTIERVWISQKLSICQDTIIAKAAPLSTSHGTTGLSRQLRSSDRDMLSKSQWHGSIYTTWMHVQVLQHVRPHDNLRVRAPLLPRASRPAGSQTLKAIIKVKWEVKASRKVQIPHKPAPTCQGWTGKSYRILQRVVNLSSWRAWKVNWQFPPTNNWFQVSLTSWYDFLPRLFLIKLWHFLYMSITFAGRYLWAVFKTHTLVPLDTDWFIGFPIIDRDDPQYIRYYNNMTVFNYMYISYIITYPLYNILWSSRNSGFEHCSYDRSIVLLCPIEVMFCSPKMWKDPCYSPDSIASIPIMNSQFMLPWLWWFKIAVQITCLWVTWYAYSSYQTLPFSYVGLPLL